MTSIKSARHQIANDLAAVTDNAYGEAQQLLTHVSRLTLTQLHMLGDAELDNNQVRAIQHMVRRRLQGEPLPYLLGEWEFFGLTLSVTPVVLIPRQETEVLVEQVLEHLPETYHEVVDLGTGSGAIAAALAYNRPQWQIHAVDDSPAALRIAQSNIERHELTNIKLWQGSWLGPLKGRRFDAVVSNPPYIPSDDPHFQQPELTYEPRRALDGGPDGLEPIRQIVQIAPEYLKPGGYLFLEHGYDQQAKVTEYMKQFFAQVNGVLDYSGQPRVVQGQKSP